MFFQKNENEFNHRRRTENWEQNWTEQVSACRRQSFSMESTHFINETENENEIESSAKKKKKLG